MIRPHGRTVKKSSKPPSYYIRTRNAISEEIHRSLRYALGTLTEAKFLSILSSRTGQLVYLTHGGKIGRLRIVKGQRIDSQKYSAWFVVDIYLNDPELNIPVSVTTRRRLGATGAEFLDSPRHIRHCLLHELFEIVVRIADHICRYEKGERLYVPMEKWTESAANAVKNGGTCVSVRRTLSTYRPSPAKPSGELTSKELHAAYLACNRAKVAVVQVMRRIGLKPCNDRHEGLIVAQRGGDIAVWVRVSVKFTKEKEKYLLRFAFCQEADHDSVPRVLEKFGEEYRAVTSLRPLLVQCHIHEAASHAESFCKAITRMARKAGV